MPDGQQVIASAPVNGAFLIEHGLEDRPDNVRDSQPRISGQSIVWMRQEGTSSFYLMAYDLRMDETKRLPVEHTRHFSFDFDSGTVAYAIDGSVFVYELEADRTTALAENMQVPDGPVVRGGTVAWAQAIAEERFRPVSGEPLIDHRDFRNLMVWTFRTRTSERRADSVFMLRRLRIGPRGEIYAVVNRERSTSPRVPADLVRFD
jgi:hypothetical protein